MNNNLYLRRNGRVFVEAGGSELPETYSAALLKNLEDLGFTLTPELCERLRTLSLEELTVFYAEFIADLRAMVGAHRKFRPMYPNFPQQVMEMSAARLYLNALLHYWTNALPDYARKERLPLLEKTELRVISLGSIADFETIFTRLLSAKGSLSAEDKDDVKWFIEKYGAAIFRLMPEEIPARETVAFVGALLLKQEIQGDFLQQHMKTATDILRLAVALSEGDISLAVATKFVKFKRAQRRVLLELLENRPNLLEDMQRWKKRWIRLGEILHPGEYKERFAQTYAAFESLRKNKPNVSYNAVLEREFEKPESAELVALLKTRPGDFARRLDAALRHVPAQSDEILSAFSDVAMRVSTPVLLQMHAHFQHRQEPVALRTFFPKGNVGKAFAVEKSLPTLTSQQCAAILGIIENALRHRFAEKDALGACYVDAGLKNFPVPLAQRSASKSLRTLPRGSRLPLPAGDVMRFFLWWKNGAQRTDIDLSAALYDANFVYKDVISYYNLKNYGGHHSGDIVDAPKGAAEFIDLNLPKVLEMGARYLVISVNSYTTQPFCDLPECFAGWMARQHANSGEIFEPRTVQDRVDLASDTQICLPLMVDLQRRETIWTDLALRHYPSWNNVQNNLRGVSLMLRAMTSHQAPNLYDLFTLHAQARGTLIEKQDEAQTVFAVDSGITPYEIDRIRAEFL